MGIYLRELSSNDLSKINTWRNNQSTVSFLGGNFRFVDIAVDEEWYQNYINHRNSNIRLAICEDKTDLVIGAVYLLNIDWVNRNSEFAIWLGDENSRGKGYGRLATELAIKHAFNDLNLHRIYLSVLATNHRAITLYENVGFKNEGLLRGSIFKDGSYKDVYVMSILNGEFKQ